MRAAQRIADGTVQGASAARARWLPYRPHLRLAFKCELLAPPRTEGDRWSAWHSHGRAPVRHPMGNPMIRFFSRSKASRSPDRYCSPRAGYGHRTFAVRLRAFSLLILIATAAICHPVGTTEAKPLTLLEHPCLNVCATREAANRFNIVQGTVVIASLTFLERRTVHLKVHARPGRPNRLPEYMLVRSDASYASEQVQVERRPTGLVFAAGGVRVEIGRNGDLPSITVRSNGETLIRNWRIDPTGLRAVLDLARSEHIYGFGDKRAALDQHGRRVEMLNRDAFASETNESYKSIPFYLSSAGYGLFFHNFYPSIFDVGASQPDKLQLQASGGEMDFYVFIGNPKEVISRYTDLTGRPAMLPRWAFGYHQGKATYRGTRGACGGGADATAAAAV